MSNLRSIRVPSAFHPRSIRVPSENPNLAKHPFGGRGRAGPGRPVRGPGLRMGVLPSLGSQMVRGWNADGTQMERDGTRIQKEYPYWNADGTRIKKRYPYSLTIEGPISFTLNLFGHLHKLGPGWEAQP